MKKRGNSIEFVIAGGLGNQLFMLCAGLYFAERFKRAVTFDLSDLERISILHPGLNIYNLGLVREDQVCRMTKPKWKVKIPVFVSRIFAKMFRMLGPFTECTFRRIDEIGFVDLASIPTSINRIEGYFQSWRYFSDLSEKPMLGIQSLASPSDWFLQQKKLLDGKEFAALHIRRGDYTHRENRASGILSVEYFRKVTEQLPKQIEILVFTDSPDEVNAELSEFGRRFRVINPPTESDPVESLILMSQASHIAISNSTYSWWAATLASEDTVIFAPTKWFELKADPVDLIPNSWVKVQSEWVNQ